MRNIENYELNHVYGGLGPDEYAPVTVSTLVVTAASRGPSIDYAFQAGLGFFGPLGRLHLGTDGTSGAVGAGLFGTVMFMMGDSAMIADQRKASELACEVEAKPLGGVGIHADLKSGENSLSVGPISMGNQGTNSIGPLTYNPQGEWMFQVGFTAGCYVSINVGDSPK